ncbi:MAG: hypothetical protein COB60_05760 [Flavobacteriaceae bacterium]|nr:MAG: hypothetical protein COB60_05760 [Flavobacteriaceae bacterium]
MKLNNKLSSLLILIGLIFIGCDDVLDKDELAAISNEQVWDDENLAEGFLNEIYDRGLSGWSNGASGLSDDAQGANSVMYGEVNSSSKNSYGGTYGAIKNINLLLANVGTGALPEDFQNSLIAQSLFFRAKHYFSLVSTYGGVPLVLELNDLNDELEIPRNKTSECINQIIIDLDKAITGLPSSYDDAGSDYGRITKGAAMAFKAKVLLFYASEQFDPSQSEGRWQAAYEAVSTAKTYLEGQGKGLYPDYAELWFDESDSNSEAIIIRRYTTDKTHSRDVGVRPFVTGTSGESWDKPSIGIAEAYPMKDGKAIDDATSSYSYDTTVFWENRDPRFNANIARNGALFSLNDPAPQTTSDLVWTFVESQIEAGADERISPSALLCKKAVDGSIAGGGDTYNGTTDWIEMRFAEVLLFFAESANEIGKTSEAYDALIKIRTRAGIEAGTGFYGLKEGMDKDEMRTAIMLERRLELVFEGKRSSDLRRRRMYSTLNGTHRKGYVIERTAAFDALDPSDEVLDDRKALENGVLDGSIDLSDPTVYNTYFTTVLTSLERDGNTLVDGISIDYQDKYYFFDLPQGALNSNPKLVQTEGWGGTFDPLQ